MTMKTTLLRLILVSVLLVFFAGSAAHAQGKKGSAESPAGWEKGGKKSWEGEVPPGTSEDKPGKEGTQGAQKGQEQGKKTQAKGEPSVDKKKEGNQKGKGDKDLEQETQEIQKGKSKKK